MKAGLAQLLPGPNKRVIGEVESVLWSSAGKAIQYHVDDYKPLVDKKLDQAFFRQGDKQKFQKQHAESDT